MLNETAVLYSDESLLVVIKPSGLRVIPDGYDPSLPYLSGMLQEQFGRVWVAHRLDKDTSGVILFARSPEAHRALNTQFERRETHKEYHAIVIGEPEWKDALIDLPLHVDGDRRHRTTIDHQYGKAAETEVRVLQLLKQFALVAALPRTGYTHQIRAHLAAVDYPILADPLYQSLKPETQTSKIASQVAAGLPIHRAALHAYQITFTHPITGQPLTLQASYPEDFAKTLSALAR